VDLYRVAACAAFFLDVITFPALLQILHGVVPCYLRIELMARRSIQAIINNSSKRANVHVSDKLLSQIKCTPHWHANDTVHVPI
jgi:hypothetical protein